VADDLGGETMAAIEAEHQRASTEYAVGSDLPHTGIVELTIPTKVTFVGK